MGTPFAVVHMTHSVRARSQGVLQALAQGVDLGSGGNEKGAQRGAAGGPLHTIEEGGGGPEGGGGSPQKKKGRGRGGPPALSAPILVAAAGFEPATKGL